MGGPFFLKAAANGRRRTSNKFASLLRVERCHPRLYFDYLCPTQSHLLNITLLDKVPESMQPDYFPNFRSRPEHRLVVPPPIHPMPLGHHLVYFPPQLPLRFLLHDGTHIMDLPDPAPRAGTPALVRRVWAGGSLTFRPDWQTQLRLDNRRAVCVEQLAHHRFAPDGDSAEELDKSAMADLWRWYAPVPSASEPGKSPEDLDAEAVARAMSEPVIRERRTLAFLPELSLEGAEAALREAESPKAVSGFQSNMPTVASMIPTQAMLFQISALTFNAHTIHLDGQYCREREGRPALLVQGSLSLILMLSAVQSRLGPGEYVSEFTYRLLRPLYVNERLSVSLRPAAPLSRHVPTDAGAVVVCVHDADNLIAAKGRADLARHRSSTDGGGESQS